MEKLSFETRSWNALPRLRMAEPLESAYRLQQRQHAMVVFRLNVVFIFALWLVVSAGIYQLMPPGELPLWLRLYGGVGVIIVVAGALAWLPVLEPWFHVYTGIGSFLAVALSVAIPALLPDPVPGQLAQPAINYCMVIVYGLVGLRFDQAVIAGWLGGLGGVVLGGGRGGGGGGGGGGGAVQLGLADGQLCRQQCPWHVPGLVCRTSEPRHVPAAAQPYRQAGASEQ